MVLAVQQAAGAVAFGRGGAVAAVARKQFARAEGEDVVDVFFDDPRLAHPPAVHLPDDGVHPQEFFDFGGGVVAVVDDSFLGLVTEGGEGVARVGVQAVVEAALRRAVGFAAVDEEDVHGGSGLKVRIAQCVQLFFGFVPWQATFALFHLLQGI